MRKLLRFIAHEIREAVPVFLFFLVIFGLGRITLALTLEGYDVSLTATAVAIVGALIVAKAILLADALPFTNLFAKRALVYAVAWKSAIYWVITSAFRYLEELLHAMRSGDGFAGANESMLQEVSWPHFWAVQLWIGFALVAYCTVAELVRVIGKERVRTVFFVDGQRADA